MEISITTLGAGQEVGRSCIIVKIKDVRIMLDCGAHMAFNDERKFPEFKRLVKTKSKYNNFDMSLLNNNSMYKNLEEAHDYNKAIDLLIISHFHLDHCGTLAYFTELLGYSNPIICTQPTKAILPVTLEDFRKIISEYRGEKSLLLPEQITACMNKIKTIEINETQMFLDGRIKVTAFYAGHVLGAAMFLIDVDGYTVAYTGDYNTISDRHLSGAYMPKLNPNVLITETTYGDKVRDTKRARERKFLSKIQETIDKGGKVLIPIFALGRAQELCIVLDTYWRRTRCEVPIYFAGPMAKKANFYYKLFQNWMNSTIKNLFIKDNVFDFKFVKQDEKGFTKGNHPMVIFATPGMLHGGMSLNLFKQLAPDSKNCVIIPGYCSVGTVGNRILSGDKYIEIDKTIVEVKCEVYYMSFSAHADAKGLLQLINNVNPKNVILIHGDKEIMKQFQNTWKEKSDIPITMPANYEKTKFPNDPKYYQYDIGYSLFQVIRVLFKIKSDMNKGTNSVLFKGLCLRDNKLDIDKVNVFKNSNGKGIRLKNKVSFIIHQESVMEVYIKFIEKYYPFSKEHFDRLTKNKSLTVSLIQNKVVFMWNYNNSKYDEVRNYVRIMKMIKIFDKINRINEIDIDNGI